MRRCEGKAWSDYHNDDILRTGLAIMALLMILSIFLDFDVCEMLKGKRRINGIIICVD
jgi:hypothetical protein